MIPSPPVSNEISAFSTKKTIKKITSLNNNALPPQNLPPQSPEVKKQFEGNLYNGFNPSDNSMAVADEGWIVTVVNSSINIYSEEGNTLVYSQPVSTFYNYLNYQDDFFNTRIIFDPVNDRFILTTLNGKTPETSRMVVSFSKSQNPMDGWWNYTFDDIAGSSNTWLNNLQSGVSAEDLYLTGQLYNTGGTISSTVILQIDKDTGYEGQNLSYTYWNNVVDEDNLPTGSITLVPDGLGEGFGPGIYLLASKSTGGNTLQLYKIDSDSGLDPVLYTFIVDVPAYSLGNNGPQLGSTKLLSTQDCRIQGAYFANGTIYYVHHDRMPSGENGIRFGKLGLGNTVDTSFLFGITGNTLAFPAIAPFTNGIGNSNNVLLGYCSTASSFYPRFNAATIGDDFSTVNPIVVKAGLTPISGPSGNIVPWGRSSGISRQHFSYIPSVWLFGSYGKTNLYGNWVAKIAPLGSGPNQPCEQAASLTCDTIVSGITSGSPQILPPCETTVSTAPGVWYRIVGQGTELILSTCSNNTNFNTKIAVFTGDCSNLNCVTAVDDSGCSAHPNHTVLTFYAADGEEYYIFVTGAGTATGTFELSITCAGNTVSCTGNQQITTCSGTISDGSGGNPYSNNLDCSWTISPTAATSVTLTFNAFDTEENFDYVNIYDGTSSNDLLLGSYSGNTIPGTFTASSGSLFVKFITDGSTIKGGWSASYTCTALTPPDPDFTANPLIGNAPLSVNFNNLTNNPSASYLWNFGDNMSSTEENPVHVYSLPGTYTVNLKAANIAGNKTKTRDAYITVNPNAQAPLAQFNASALCGQSTLTVNFQDLSTNTPSSWNWDFGNGQTSTAQNPICTYNQPGIYTVKLTVGNIAGSDVEIKTSLITITAPLIITSDPGTSVCLGTPVNLQVNGANTYSWVGTGLNINTGGQVIVNPTNPGNFNYTVVGMTNNCASEPANINLIFKPHPVVAVNASSNTVCFGQSVTFAANGAVAYNWSGAGISSATGASITANPIIPGTYTYNVTGTTNGCASDPASVSVSFVAPPLVNLSISSSVSCVGTPIQLMASGASIYQWTGLGLIETQGAQVNANPNFPGSYSYQVIGSQNGCQSAPVAVSVQFNSLPIISVSPQTAVLCAGEAITLTAGGANFYTWLGPGLNTNNLGTLSLTPPDGMTQYTVRGTVNGCQSEPQTVTIEVNPKPVLLISGNENPICLGDTVRLSATGADQYNWLGPNLLLNSGPSVTALPLQAGVVNYQVSGINGNCPSDVTTIPVTVLSYPLSVEITQLGCPGPNLTYSTFVVNGAAFNNITWYLNGNTIWAGPTYTLFNASNGSEVYCTVVPQNPSACTQPAIASSNLVTVDCIPLAAKEPALFESVNIVPNPNNGSFQLYIQSKQAFPIRISLYNNLGQLIAQQPEVLQSGENTYPFNFGQLASGIYRLNITSEQGTQFVQWIKE